MDKQDEMDKQEWTGHGKYFHRPAYIDAIMKMNKKGTISEKIDNPRILPKFYCEKCGKELIWTEKDKNNFNTDTGKKEKHCEAKCPNKKYRLDSHEFMSWNSDDPFMKYPL